MSEPASDSETLLLPPPGDAGRRVGKRYRLVRELGHGAFGAVWEAADELLHRPVALKRVRLDRLPGAVDPTAMLAEARTIARLDHPHVVPIYDAGRESDEVWIAMKLVGGTSLGRLLASRGALPRAEALELLRQLLSGLGHAHRRGVVHRDVKPSNVLVETDEQGRPHIWLTDFGIAKVVSGGTTEHEAVIAGTPSYMAPEQITGRRVDGRADLFAVGCVAIEMLTGQRAFPAAGWAGAVLGVVHEAPGGLDIVAERHGDALAETLRRWLAKSPEDRPRSAAEAAADLARLERSRARRWWRPSFRRAAIEWDGGLAVETRALEKGYGWRSRVLRGLDLAVPTGAVYALLGRNGCGKTTLIRTLLGIYRPDRGAVRLFGRDPWRDGAKVRRRLAFVPEALYAFESMKVSELLDFVRSGYASWDQKYCYELLQRFELPLAPRLRNLSRGMQTKATVVAALAARPELLVLDDPTVGLDAVVLDELIQTLEEAARRHGTTVLVASHEYEQIERIATHVGFLKDGRMLFADTLEHLKQRVREVELEFPDEIPEAASRLDSFRVLAASGRRLRGVVLDTSSDTLARLQALGPAKLVVNELSLREIFVNYLR